MKISPAQSASEGFERAEWTAADKDTYPVRLKSNKQVENRFYHSEPWTDGEGKEHTADYPDNEFQFSITFEIIDGERTGEWVSVFANKWYTVDGRGKLAIIAKAIDPDCDLSKGVDLDELESGLLRATIEPSSKNNKYGHITDFMPMKKKDKDKYNVTAQDVADELGAEVIPF